MNAADSRQLLNEAAGVMAMGDAAEVLEYARRLLDLPENGLHADVQRIESLVDDLTAAEAKRHLASKALHDAAEKLLRTARKHWKTKDVIIALFGDDR